MLVSYVCHLRSCVFDYRGVLYCFSAFMFSVLYGCIGFIWYCCMCFMVVSVLPVLVCYCVIAVLRLFSYDRVIVLLMYFHQSKPASGGVLADCGRGLGALQHRCPWPRLLSLGLLSLGLLSLGLLSLRLLSK